MVTLLRLPTRKSPLNNASNSPLSSGEILAQLCRRRVQFRIRAVGQFGRRGQRTSDVYTSAVAFGLRELEMGTLGAGELAHM